MIIPPYVATYATQNPYITVQEFLNSPTGVDVTQLNSNGGNLSQTQTLENMIRRASGWADSLCNQKLAATVDTKAGRFRVRTDGTIMVPLQFTPVLGISSISAGWTPSSLAALNTDLMPDVWPDANNILTVPVRGLAASLYSDRAGYGGDMYCTIQYVNGWADTQVTTGIAAGDLSLTVGSALGVNPGQTLTLYDGTMGETVTVASSFVPSVAPGTASIPLASAVANAYVTGATLTAMPQEIKQAVISLTCVLIKTRGSESMVMQNIHGQPMQTDKMEGGAGDDWEAAVDLLQAFKRVI